MPTIKRQKIGPWQEAWLQSLESGEHKQCRGILCQVRPRSYAFCCLGLACEMLLQNGVPLEVSEYSTEFVIPEDRIAYDKQTKVLPKKVTEALGFRNDCAAILVAYLPTEDLRVACLDELCEGDNEIGDLTEANDELGWSFKRIATFCRKYPEAVFKETK